MFMIFWTGGHVHDLQNQLLLTVEPLNYFYKDKKNHISVGTLFLEISWSQKTNILEKTRAETSLSSIL